MLRNDIVVRVAGEGGEGVISVAEILTRAAVNSGLDIFTFRTYPAEIKGGLAMMMVRMSNRPLSAIGRDADVFMAFNQEAVDTYGLSLNEGGVLLYDPKHCELPADYPFKSVPVPLHDTAMTETGARITKNIVALAALVRCIDIAPDHAKDLIVKKFKRKGEDALNKNNVAFEAGLKLLKESDEMGAYELEKGDPSRHGKRIVISGNQSISMGALAGGCRFVGGYPITPATQVLEFMMKYLPGLGGTVVQAEDEISAIASCLGASYAGAKSMTATSGPGLALMSELIGMASMSEIPIVIIDVQRSGPGTGMPTKTEQADLMYALHGTPGEAPRIVLAPTTIEDCFYQAVHAFNLAERYQMPVILLSDQSLAYRQKTVDIPELDSIELASRDLAGSDVLSNGYQRYAHTDSGVSPLTVPGMDGGMFVASGLEHDEDGAPNYTPENREKMVAKRYKKLETLAGELDANGNGVYDSADGAEIGVIGWGSTEGPIAEAIQRVAKDGVRIAHLQPKVLNPLPEKKIGTFLKPLKKVIVIEENHNAQLSNHLKTRFEFDPIEINQCSGLPFTSDDIYASLKEHV